MMVVVFAALMLDWRADAQSGESAACLTVIPPPDSFFQNVRERDRDAAREFYKKYMDIKGIPLVAAVEVADLAMQRTYDIVTHMLAGRPDVLKAMVDQGMYLVIIGSPPGDTDLPENRNARNPDYLNERVRGTGGLPTSFGEENLLSLPIDRYDDESIAVHEFCHTIDSTLASIDPTLRERKNAAYRNAVDKGLFKDTYAGSNSSEYWCEIAQAYFDCNRINNWNHGPIGGREQLKIYDPQGYELVRTSFNLSPEQDWRYRPLQKLPNVIPPPAKFKVDPYYPANPHATSCQVIRVFAKAIYYVTGMRPVDPNWDSRPRWIWQQSAFARETKPLRRRLYELRLERMDIRFDEKLKLFYDSAVSKGRWKGTAAIHSRVEYWAEGALAYFDAVGTAAPAPNDAHHPITTREALKEYDPDLFALVDETMAYKGKVDWRYRQ
jgi:alpha-glucosidase